jgi:hypothetical protein
MILYSRGRFLVLALMATVVLSGCTVHQRLATQAVNFNLAVEKAQNEMLLLNVVRAKDRLPMYLTGMSSLTGNVQTTVSATAGGTYTRVKGSTGSTGSMTAADSSTSSTAGNMVSGMLTHTYMPSAMASEMENPTYTLSVLDTQEFMQGFMSPLSKNIFAYYWNQGWPPEVLLYFLAEAVEVKEGDSKPVTYKNYPDTSDSNLCELVKFGAVVQHFLALRPTLQQASESTDIGPRLPSQNLLDLDKLVKLAKEELSLTYNKKDDSYQLQRMQPVVKFDLAGTDPSKHTCKPSPLDPCQEPPSTDPCNLYPPEDHSKDESKIDYSAYVYRLDDKKAQMKSAQPDKTTITFVLRSPEALLYYLGELSRVENREILTKVVPEVCIQQRFQPLFIALAGANACPGALLSTESTQGTYSIPALDPDSSREKCNPGELQLKSEKDKPWPVCNAGRSMQAFRLLNQVMALQKSAKDFPAPALVRVIGQ